HESATAALAKAISEEAPPIRQKRPDVPQALEAVIAKGLERDRDNRWQSLEEMRDALIALLPSRQHPARPRVLIGAYIIDRILLFLIFIPLELLRHWGTQHDSHLHLFDFRWVSFLMLLGYFSLGEGVFGATFGKWLLGLRVSRLGQTGPPGVWRAFIRA